MSRCNWIVCERTNRWASALRAALANDDPPFRLRETRRLADLDDELAQRGNSLAAIEVRHDNFADVLRWLAAARRDFPGTRSVALVDRSLVPSIATVGGVLVEAGAVAVTTSPRRLTNILFVGRRHAETTPNLDENLPLADRLWASLPWQSR